MPVSPALFSRPPVCWLRRCETAAFSASGLAALFEPRKRMMVRFFVSRSTSADGVSSPAGMTVGWSGRRKTAASRN